MGRIDTSRSGVPDFGDCMGYITCDLAITGLETAGAPPTRQGFVSGLRTVSSYAEAGLACQPIALATAHYGKFADVWCEYAMYVKAGKYVIRTTASPSSGRRSGRPTSSPPPRTGARGTERGARHAGETGAPPTGGVRG